MPRNVRKLVGITKTSACLLDIVAVTGGAAANPAFTTVVTPYSGAPFNTNGLLCSRSCGIDRSIIAMNADEVATQVMLAAE